MDSFTKKEIALIKKLNTPVKVQDFLNKIPFNFEKNGETLRSPLFTLRSRQAHCFEGALLGAYILSVHGLRPFLVHLKAKKNDYDHVLVLFKINGLWGALSKTNHSVLRYREAIYKNVHEIVLSFFHEYFLDDGQKTLRQYSKLLSLKSLPLNWVTKDGNLWEIDKKLDEIKHYNIVPQNYIKKLRKADKIEIVSGEITEFKK